MTEFPVNYNIHELPVTGIDLNSLYNALVSNLSGSIDEVVLPASLEPEDPITPRFDGAGWKVWDEELNTYKPDGLFLGHVALDASPTSNRIQDMQAKSGTIALLDDIYGKRETITLQEGLVSVDWDKASSFRVILSGNRETAFYMFHSRPGMEIDLLIINNGTNQTVGAWDPAVEWQLGVIPDVPPANPGSASSLLVTLRNVNGTIYAETVNQEQHPAIV